MPTFRVHLRDGQVIIVTAPSADEARHRTRSAGAIAKIKLARGGK